MTRVRRDYGSIETAVFESLKSFGKKGASISQISMEAKTNWKTTRNTLERLEKLGVVVLVSQDEKLKIYRLKNGGP